MFGSGGRSSSSSRTLATAQKRLWRPRARVLTLKPTPCAQLPAVVMQGRWPSCWSKALHLMARTRCAPALGEHAREPGDPGLERADRNGALRATLAVCPTTVAQHGNTALSCAARQGHADVARLLLSRGASVTDETKVGCCLRQASAVSGLPTLACGGIHCPWPVSRTGLPPRSAAIQPRDEEGCSL